MFTGIVSSLGKVLNKTSSKLTIGVDKEWVKSLTVGLSVAVNGICLTLVDKTEGSFSADYIPETANRTNIKHLKLNDLVNLELPATPATLLSGHIVQGHIDAVVKLKSIITEGNSFILKFSLPQALSDQIVEKGSVALNGVSLTVIKCGKDFFTVGIIPHTWEKTMLHNLKRGDFVNIETDILAKYIQKQLEERGNI